MTNCYVWETLLCAVLLFSLTSTARAETPAETARETEIVQRAVVDLGDTARLQAVLAKARRGEPVTVGVLGGSITQGASATAEENRYGNRMAKWWRDTFPKAQIEFVNAGIGATGSDIGAHRVREHLLAKHPDFVVVEYAVNDSNTPVAAETLEGVLRQILNAPNHPAVMLLFMMSKGGGNAQEQHSIIGHYYNLPMVSYRDTLWPEIQTGRMKWEDVEADEVHPNDRGHAYAARFVTGALERVLAKLPSDDKLPRLAAVPAPKISNLFEYTAMHNVTTLKPIRNEGWEVCEDSWTLPFFGKGFKAVKPGSTIEFEVTGRAISVLFYRIKGAMGIAEAQVDNAAPVRMDGWFEATWGGYTPFQCIARDLKPGKHRVRITVLNEKNPGSTGNEFRIYSIMTAGIKKNR